MKKIRLVLSIVMVLYVLVACGASAQNEVKHYTVEAKGVWFDTLEEMENYSELIVRVKRLDQEEAMITTVNGRMVSGFTFSQVEIKEIYQDTAERYSIGDTITILENEVYDEKENIVYHIGGYNMMEVGKEYLLFLDYSITNGMEYYVASGVELGTISLESDNRQRTYANQLGEEIGDYSVFQDMWEEALEKYIK